MTDILEKRVAEVETLVWEIPNLMNLRFGRYETELSSMRSAIVDNTSRLVAVERSMTMLQTDMRDLRGGVTRQLVAQDQRLAEIEKGLSAVWSEVAGIKSEIGDIKAKIGDMKTEIGGMKSEISGIKSEIGGIKAEISGMKTEIAGVKTEFGSLKAEFAVLKEMLAEVLRRLPAP